MRLKWWELAVTMKVAEDALATRAQGVERLTPYLFAISAILLMAGVVVPIVQVSNLLIFSDRISIVGSIASLWRSNEYFIATIIVIFSILLPVMKIVLADYVWRGCSFLRAEQGRSIGILELVGRWSMLDVLIIALIIVSLKSSMFGDARSELGIYFFSASIFFSSLGVGLIRRAMKRQSKTDSQALSCRCNS